MAINLTKPAAGTQVVQAPQADDVIFFNFPTTDVVLNRVDNNLVLEFDDGSSISLTDFYNTYNSENMPTFNIDGAEIDGETFFTALDATDLMPAAGPAAAPVNADGSFFDGGAGASLLGGVDYLGGLDLAQAASDVDFEDQDGELPNGSPFFVGITVFDEDPDASVGVLDVIESGHGRNADGSLSPNNANQEYAGDLFASGQINAVDPEGEPLTFTVVGSNQGAYGSIVVDPSTGEFTYSFEDGANHSLKQGEEATESFQVVVSDPFGNSVTVTINVEITGTNDKPTLSLTASGLAVTEDVEVDEVSGNLVATGTASGDDLDDDAILTFGLDAPVNAADTLETSVSGNYGTFTIDPTTGVYTYTAQNDQLAIQELGVGETLTETFTVYVRDEHGAYSELPVTVTINGTNDVPVIDFETSDVVLNVKEAGVESVTITGSFWGIPYSYEAHANTEQKGDAEDDGYIIATDTDKNDILSFSFTQDAGANPADNVNDVDGTITVNGSDFAYTDSIEGVYGTIYLNSATGAYTYVLNNADSDTQNLAEGQKVDEKFEITVSDGKGGSATANVTVNIEGTNDVPQIDSVQNLEFVDNLSQDAATLLGLTQLKGTATASDFDTDSMIGGTDKLYFGVYGEHGQVPDKAEVGHFDFTIKTAVGKYGVLTIDQSTGEYTYTVSNAVIKALGEDESYVENFTIYVRDEQGAYAEKPITVTVTGVNDGPTDFTVIVTDGTIIDDGVGRNLDGSIIDGSPAEENTPYAGDIVAKGTLAVVDLDINDDVTFTAVGTPTITYENGNEPETLPNISEFGTFEIKNVDGGVSKNTATYEFILDKESDVVNSLNEGETVTITYKVEANDGKGGIIYKDVTITIKGTNDIPTVSADTTADVTSNQDGVVKHVVLADDNEDITVNGKLSVADADDDGDTLAEQTFSVVRVDGTGAEIANTQVVETEGKNLTIKGEFGVLTIMPNGEYTYTLYTENDGTDYDALEALGKDVPASESFVVTTTDAHGANDSIQLDFNVKGANDVPTDFEVTPENTIVLESGVGRDADGNTFDKGTAEQENRDYSSSLTVSGTLSVTDVDTTDDVSFSVAKDENDKEIITVTDATGKLVQGVTAADFGSFVITDGDGDTASYEFTLTETNNDVVNSLNEGEKITITYKVEANDGNGGIIYKDVTITIEGTNDQPIISSEMTSTDHVVTEDNKADTATGTIKVDDADDDGDELTEQTLSITFGSETESAAVAGGNVEINGTYGTLTINGATGSYEYSLQNEMPDVADYTSATDPEYLAAVARYEAVQALGKDVSKTESFTVTTTDAHGANDSIQLDFNVKGVNDAPNKPIINAEDLLIAESGVGRIDETTVETDASKENDAYTSQGKVTGSLVATDVDTDDVLTFSVDEANATVKIDGIDSAIAATSFGKFDISQLDIDVTGDNVVDKNSASFTFTLSELDSSGLPNSVVNSLNEGQKVEITYKVVVSDANGLENYEDVTITIVGTNDKPEIELAKTNIVGDIIVDEHGVEHATHNTLTEGGTGVAGTQVWGSLKVNDADTDGFGLNGVHAEGNSVNDGQTLSVVRVDSTDSSIEIGDADVEAKDDTVIKIDGEYGTLTIYTTTGQYFYEMGATEDQQKALEALGDDDLKTESFKVTTTDKHGAYDDAVLNFKVQGVNDAPTLDMAGSEITSYDVLVNEDDPATADMNEDVLDSGVKYPADVNNPDGSYYPSGTVEGSFTFKDVDTAVTDLTITIGGVEFTVQQAAGGALSLVAKNGETQIVGNYGNLSNFEISGPDANGYYKVDYDYTQTKTSLEHSKDDNEQTATDGNLHEDADKFEVKVSDGIGTEQTGSIAVDIVDDVIVLEASASDVYNKVIRDVVVEYELDAGNVSYVPKVTVENVEVFEYTSKIDPESSSAGVSGDMDWKGADGASSVTVDFIVESMGATYTAVVLNGQPVGITSTTNGDGEKVYTAEFKGVTYFTFTLNSETGKWDFKQYEPFGEELTLKFVATDADGDSDTQYVVIKGDDSPVANDAHVELSEAYLPDGSGQDPDDEFANRTEGTTGVIFDFGNDGPLASNAIVWNAPAGITIDGKELTWNTAPDGTLTGVANGETILTITPQANGTAKVVLNNSFDFEGDGYNINKLEFEFTLTDSDGDQSSGKLTVDVQDDVPEVTTDVTAVLNADNTATAIVELDFGADDGAGKTLEFGGSTFEFDGTNWTSDNGGTISLDGKTLTATDGTTLSNNGSSDLWTVKYDASVDKSETITLTDADGDKAEVSLEAKPTAGELVALDGTPGQFVEGTNYNMSFILDTSGTMYGHGAYKGQLKDEKTGELIKDENVGGIEGNDIPITRLDATCDAIIDFLQNDLSKHIDSEVGGSVNISVVVFWQDVAMPINYKDIQPDQIDDIVKEIEALRDGLKYGSAKEYTAEGGTIGKDYIEYDANGDGIMEKYALLSTGEIAYNTGSLSVTDDAWSTADGFVLPENPTDEELAEFYQWHWGTNYEKGLLEAAEWYAGLKDNGYENNIYFFSDGDPTYGDKTASSLLDKFEKESGLAEGDYTITAVGVGAGAKEGVLNGLNTDGDAEMVPDQNIGEIFDLLDNKVNAQDANTSVGYTGAGSDVAISGIELNELLQMVANELSVSEELLALLDKLNANSEYELTDADKALFEPFVQLVIGFLQNYPEWVQENIDSKSENDPASVFLTGDGDDAIYSQEGNDLLIGDGDKESLRTLAEAIFTEATDPKASEYEWDALREALGLDLDADDNSEKTKGDELIENLVDKLHSALVSGTSAEKAAVINAINSMEEAGKDGNDTIYGNDGNDILIGLGGNDRLEGGEGNDILLGGSGNDILDGGTGDDVLIGGAGADIMRGNEGNDIFFFDKDDTLIGGEGFDIAVGSIEDIQSQLSEDTGVELFIQGSVDTVSGNTNDILASLGISKGDDGELNLVGAWGKVENDDDDDDADDNGYTHYKNSETNQEIWIKTDDDDTTTFSGDIHGENEVFKDLNVNEYQADSFEVELYHNDDNKPADGKLAETIADMMDAQNITDMTSESFMTENGMSYDGETLVLDANWEFNANNQWENSSTGLTLLDNAESELEIKITGGGF